MSSFDVTFLGSSGGPLEGTTCGILLKPTNITYLQILQDPSRQDCLLCIDAGAGLSSLTEIIYNEVLLDKQCSKLSGIFYKGSMEKIQDYYNVVSSKPFACLANSLISSPFKISQLIFNSVKSYLITHPHLDHIAALVINSAGFTQANPRSIYGSYFTTKSLQEYIFNGIIWPNMPDFNLVHLNPKVYNEEFHVNNNNYTVTMFELTHGRISSGNPSNCEDRYQSSAFLITYNITSESILIFGDFESDTVSKLNTNANIWHLISPLIITGKLSTIILECSSHSNSDSELHGHLRPDHLIHELKQLELECLKWPDSSSSPLKDFNIIVNHVKEPILENDQQEIIDPRKAVLESLNQLNEAEGLGVKFSIALSGVSYTV